MMIDEAKGKKQEIIDDLEIEMKSRSLDYIIDYPNWYAGVTKDPSERFEWHKSKLDLDEKGTFIRFFYKNAGSSSVAREIENYFVQKDCKGGGGGGDDESRYIYVFTKILNTALYDNPKDWHEFNLIR